MSDLTDFRVNDLVYTNSNLIFILESPHNQEVKFGYPAAGDTGINMSKILFNVDEALGQLLKKGNSLPRSLSLINCSRLPLQESCYKGLQLPNHFINFLDIHKINDNSIKILKAKIKSKLRSPVGIKSVNSFKGRLQNCIKNSKDKKLVVCGVIAQCFFEEATALLIQFRKPQKVTWNGSSFSVFYEYHPSLQSGEWTSRTNMAGLLDYVS